MRDLEAIQRRFYGLVTSGAVAVEPGLVVSPPERLAIYARMYIDRLHDVLWDDYPKLVAVLGAEHFRDLVERYLRACPPTSFTVRDAGAALPEYLATRDDLPPWAADLARLERARVDVFDAADARPLSREDMAVLAPEAWVDFSIAWIPASTFVRVGWAVDALWSEIEDEAPIEAPLQKARTILIWRRALTVFHRTLDPDEATVAEFVRGCTIADACAAIGALDPDAPAERAVELLTRWLDAETLASGPPAS
jgi:hypothetical protein